MDYEKKYNEALKRARKIYNAAMDAGYIGDCKTLEVLFPELKESEDERIRKALIEYFNEQCDMSDWNGVYGYQVVAWLEKQGEKKYDCSGEDERIRKSLIDMLKNDEKCYLKEIAWLEKQGEKETIHVIEPKFKVGDWVVQENIGVYKVIEVCESWYEVIDFEDNHYSISFDKEYMCHLWSIQDAKHGDVLASGQVVFMFKMIHGVWLNCYCSLHNDGSFIADSYDLLTDKYFSEVHPATKEQRDTFFAKMKEAGYEWDANKKEIKKIETKGGEQ